VAHAHGRPSSQLCEVLPTADHEAENREVERREIKDVKVSCSFPGQESCSRAFLRIAGRLPLPDQAAGRVRLRAADCPFPSLVTSTDVTHGKPNPTISESRCEAGLPGFGVRRIRRCPGGYPRGKAAGSRVIAFRTTIQEAELRDAGADWC